MFDFSRRINGLTYYAGLGIAAVVLAVIVLLTSMPRHGLTVDTIIGLAVIGAALAWFVYTACLVRQRANDIGWHPLLVTVIAVWTPAFLLLGFIPSQKTSNRYGPVPQRGISLRPQV